MDAIPEAAALSVGAPAREKGAAAALSLPKCRRLIEDVSDAA